MKQWVISVAGIAILSVLADILLPNGSTRKYIKTVIGIVVTLVLAQPVLALADGNLGLQNVSAQFQPQQNYLQYVSNNKSKEVSKLKTALLQQGIKCTDVQFDNTTGTFVATLAHSFSPEAQHNARLAAQAANVGTVQFVWFSSN